MWLLALKVSRHETLHHALHVLKVLTQRLSYERAVTQNLFIYFSEYRLASIIAADACPNKQQAELYTQVHGQRMLMNISEFCIKELCSREEMHVCTSVQSKVLSKFQAWPLLIES